MKAKILGYILAGLKYLALKVLSVDLALIALIALSFLLWGPFNVTAFSERLVWTGLAIALVAGLLVFSQTSGGRTYGVPGQFLGSVHAQSLIDFNIEARQAIEGWMGIYPRMFLIGAILFGAGALVQTLFG